MAVRVSLPDRVKCVLVDDEIEVGLAVSVPGRDDAAGALIVSCMQSEEQRCNASLEARSARVVRDRREPAHRQNDGLPYRIDWRVQRHRVVRGFWIDGAGGCTPPPATGRRAAAGLYALRPFYFVRPDRAWARARQSFPCSATAMLILRRGGGRPPAIAASPMCLWASARKRRSLRILRNRTTPSPRRSALARRRFAVSENQLWRSDANPTFARGPETIADGERSLRVCQVRKPDGLLDLHSRAPRKKRRATIVQDSALCVWPPSFWMETKFERPYRLFADMG
jgi:hypothetical protein